ncbi:uncharacterized protein G2W53_003459 [Senna tora]|uniref:Uncharacterized protein n=1 Tax=Senna tora TaxID=362788 RepID=A0A834X9V7_9FABA|nr:uncharacterized protein G2W53_003459 [Senna tora]
MTFLFLPFTRRKRRTLAPKLALKSYTPLHSINPPIMMTSALKNVDLATPRPS